MLHNVTNLEMSYPLILLLDFFVLLSLTAFSFLGAPLAALPLGAVACFSPFASLLVSFNAGFVGCMAGLFSTSGLAGCVGFFVEISVSCSFFGVGGNSSNGDDTLDTVDATCALKSGSPATSFTGDVRIGTPASKVPGDIWLRDVTYNVGSRCLTIHIPRQYTNRQDGVSP